LPSILNIETSTTLCSVALSVNGKVISFKEEDKGYTHAENLHVFINEILKEANLSPKDLSAVAVGSGPGSYTGLRIGVSAAKGLAYALNLPLISVNTLLTMAHLASQNKTEDVLYCPMLDARRMEVYCALLDKDLNFTKPTSAEIISEENYSYFKNEKPVYFFGDGMPKCKSILEKIPQSKFIDNIKPSAVMLAELSHQKFISKQLEDVAYFEPFYLKDFLMKK
jgi:tRNA threonylcarbamoyladenosine biosynthesis protein TsaB